MIRVALLTWMTTSPTEGKMPNGLRYHLLDIYLDEVTKVSKVEVEQEDDDYDEDEEEEEREEVYDISPQQTEILLHPIRKLLKESPTKPVKESAKELLEDERIPKLLKEPTD